MSREPRINSFGGVIMNRMFSLHCDKLEIPFDPSRVVKVKSQKELPKEGTINVIERCNDDEAFSYYPLDGLGSR